MLNVSMEPSFEFSVDQAGKIEFSQRRYWGYIAEKRGFAPLQFRRAGSANHAGPEFRGSKHHLVTMRGVAP